MRPLSVIARPSPAAIQAKAAQQPLLIEMPAVRHAGVQAVAEQVVHLVDVDRPGEHARQDPRGRVAGLLAQEGHDLPRLHVPVVPQHVADLAFQQKAVGKQLVARHAGQLDVLDRMAKRPVAQVVQQGGGQKDLGVLGADGRLKPLVVGQPLQIQQPQAEDAQAVLEAGMMGRRIDQRHQPQLADAGQAAEVGRVDHLPHATRERNVDLRRDADQRPPGIQGGHFGNVEDAGHT